MSNNKKIELLSPAGSYEEEPSAHAIGILTSQQLILGAI